MPIKNKISELEGKENLNNLELDFFKCRYTGKAYRIINYSPRTKGYVYPLGKYQSCSKIINGIKALKLTGRKVLIELNVTSELIAIDVFELLCFVAKNKLITQKDLIDYKLENLLQYEEEEEIVIPIYENDICNISVIKFSNQKSIIENSKIAEKNGLEINFNTKC